MTDGQSRDAIAAAKERVYQFWACMDAASEVLCEDLFTETGVLEIDPVSAPKLEVTGRAALAGFGQSRKDAAAVSGRVTRHLVSNLRPVDGPADRISLAGYVLDYVGSGPLPLELSAAAAVADFDYEIAATGADAGRLMAVRGRIVFSATSG